MIVGGLRDRLLKDSFRALIEQALNTLGWVDPGRAHRPVTLIEMPQKWDDPVAPNTVAVDFTSSDVMEWEVGSRLTQDVHLAYVEIFAENDSLGVHLSNDIRDWLRKRLQADPTGVTFPIFDYRQPATPPVIGYMDFDAVTALRSTQATENLWLRHWFRVRCEIHDTYSAVSPFVPVSPLVPVGPLVPASPLIPDGGLFPADPLFPGSGPFPAETLYPGS
jgi:hypothetical protein